MARLASDFVHPRFLEGNLAGYRKRLIRLSARVYFFCVGLDLVVAWLLPEDQVYWPGVYLVSSAALLSATALAFVPWQRYRPNWMLVITALAVIQISVLTIVTGKEESPFFPLYLFVIILSGAYFTGPALIATIVLVAMGSATYHLFEVPIHLDLAEHVMELPVYVVAVLVTNLIFKDLQRRSAQAQRQTRQLEALHEATRLLHAESTSKPLFEKFLEVARRATGARYAALRTFDESGRLAAFYHAGLSDEERVLLKEPPGDTGILGAITAAGPPLRLEDLTRDPRHAGFPGGHPIMKTLLGVPITSGSRLLGKLYLTEKSGGLPFTAEDEALVAALARDAAIAIEKARLLEKIAALAVTDGLTGLYNHRAFQERLDEEVARASRYRHPCSLLMADVDDFKRINDRYGHPVGDAALKAIADALRSQVRNIDFCARYGGEELAILLPETNKQAALLVAERLRAAVASLPFKGPDGDRVTLSVSIGLASHPEDADRPDLLIRAADEALYEAKRGGKNCVAMKRGGEGIFAGRGPSPK